MLGVARRPTIRQQRLQVRLTHAQPEQDLSNIGPRLQTMTLRSGKDREQHRRSRTRRDGMSVERVIASMRRDFLLDLSD